MFMYQSPRFYMGAVVRYTDGTEETIERSVTLLVEGLLVDGTSYPDSNTDRERFVPWVHIREVSKR
jgi:hypothetical protein